MDRKTIGEYKVVKKLGEGSFGEVFLVKDDKGNLFAAKLLQVVDQNSLESIAKELSIHKQLKHPNLIEAYKAMHIKEDRSIAVIMEYCEQGTLTSHIGKLKKIETKAALMLEIALGLEYMHNTKSIVHRDLKTDNILIKNSCCKIADYGLSKNIKSFAQTKVGTPIYIAPELLLSDKYDFSVDIWSLGIIFIEILTDKRIIEHLGASLALELPCQREPFPTEAILNQIESTTFRKLLVAMLVKNPAKRINISQVIAVIKSKFQVSNSQPKNEDDSEKKKLMENAAKLELLAALMRGLAVEKKSEVKEVPKPNQLVPGSKSILSCDKNHELKRYTNLYGRDSYKCDSCKADKNNKTEPSSNCQECTYDLCPTCTQIMEAQFKRLIQRATMKKKMCPQGHELKNYENVYGSNAYKCKKCNKPKDNEEDKSFHCKECKYDICQGCSSDDKK